MSSSEFYDHDTEFYAYRTYAERIPSLPPIVDNPTALSVRELALELGIEPNEVTAAAQSLGLVLAVSRPLGDDRDPRPSWTFVPDSAAEAIRQHIRAEHSAI